MFSRWPLVATLVVAAAANDVAAAGPTQPSPEAHPERGWAVHLDNDLFALTERDRDYTAGVAFTLGGRRATEHALSLDRPLRRLDEWTGFARSKRSARVEADGLEIGLLLFTPQSLEDTRPRFDDRPYASLLYAASTTVAVDEQRGIAYQSSLTLGLLGLPLAEQVHRTIHDVFGSNEPQGYEHQISAGGEPTGRYVISRRKLLARGERRGQPYSLRFGMEGSVGYLTQASAEISIRAGNTTAPWWTSWPAVSGYAGHPRSSTYGYVPRSRRAEVAFEAGAKLSVRLYNSFLQGQFRDSPVELSSSQVSRLVGDVWAGVTVALPNDLTIGYSVHRQTEEIETGPASRALTWASIDIAQRF
jgi:hypothetical protein